MNNPGHAKPPPGPAMWDQRYAEAHEAYGTEPNAFVSAVAGRIPSGPVLVIAAGEGRNALHVASLGHQHPARPSAPPLVSGPYHASHAVAITPSPTPSLTPPRPLAARRRTTPPSPLAGERGVRR